MNIVLVGKGKMLSAMIEGCIDAKANIVGVLRYETVHTHNKFSIITDFISPTPDKVLINKYKLRDLKFKSVNSKNFKKFLITKNVDIMLVGTWGEKIQKEIFDTPKIATVNIHPSLLPKYRGPNPYLEAILHGETESGVTFHLMDKNYDTGKILAQEKVTIQDYDTSEDLRNKIIYKIKQITPYVIENINSGMIIPVTQNENLATYFPLKSRTNIINFGCQTSIEISRQIRAFHPWIPCYIEYKGKYFQTNPKKFFIDKKSHKIGQIIEKNSHKKSLTIVCQDGISIRFEDLKVKSRI